MREFGNLKIGVLVFIFFTMMSCSSFSPYAKQNQMKHDYIPIIYNQKLNIQSATMGDFNFAYSNKEFKKLNPKQKPLFDNVLVYGKTTVPDYEYYILVNPENYSNENFDFRKVEIEENLYYVLVSKSAPENDRNFLMDSIQTLKLDLIPNS